MIPTVYTDQNSRSKNSGCSLVVRNVLARYSTDLVLPAGGRARRTVWMAIFFAVFVSGASLDSVAYAANPLRPLNHRNGQVSTHQSKRQNQANIHAPLQSAGVRTAQYNAGSQPLADPVAPVSYCDGNCGPVCDCEPACGVDPVCGIDAGCGFEVGCGLEVGCGVGAALEHLGPYENFMPRVGEEIVCGVDALGNVPFGCDSCGGCDGGCDACGEVSTIPVFLPFLRINWNRFDFFAGTQGYVGPMNFANTGDNQRDGSGSFGFYQGFNEGRDLRRWLNWDSAMQFGTRFTQSNLSDASFVDESRTQVFVTGGIFRRVDYGLQYGTVIDYLNDDWYYQAELVQSRSEVSWKSEGCHVMGLQYTTSLGDDDSETRVIADDGSIFESNTTFEAIDQYRLFYRQLLPNAGQWEAFAGWTDDSDGLLGASFSLPVRQRLVLQASTTYMVPSEGSNLLGHENEAWNLSLGLVYRPGGPRGGGRYSRPLFDVADNGTFMVDRTN